MSGVGRRDVFAMLGALVAAGVVERRAEAATEAVGPAGVIDDLVRAFIVSMSADKRRRIGAALGGERGQAFCDLCDRYCDEPMRHDAQGDVIDPAVHTLLASMTEPDLADVLVLLNVEQATMFFDIYRRYGARVDGKLTFRTGVNLGAMSVLAGLDVQEMLRFAKESRWLHVFDMDFSMEQIQAGAKSMREGYDSGLRS